MHLTQHITQKGKKTTQCKFYGVYRPKMLSFYAPLTEALTLQFALQKQAELIVCLSTSIHNYYANRGMDVFIKHREIVPHCQVI